MPAMIVTWTNAAGGNWSDGTNWSSSPDPPAAGDDVAVALPGSYTIALDSARNLNSLLLNDAGVTLAVGSTVLFVATTLTIDGALIPVRHLIDGRSIVQEQCDMVAYFHVELPRHDVLLAEGLAVESYLDTGDRASFGNAGETVALHPDFASYRWEAGGCAPLVVAGVQLAMVRAQLAERTAGLRANISFSKLAPIMRIG